MNYFDNEVIELLKALADVDNTLFGICGRIRTIFRIGVKRETFEDLKRYAEKSTEFKDCYNIQTGILTLNGIQFEPR